MRHGAGAMPGHVLPLPAHGMRGRVPAVLPAVRSAIDADTSAAAVRVGVLRARRARLRLSAASGYWVCTDTRHALPCLLWQLQGTIGYVGCHVHQWYGIRVERERYPEGDGAGE